MQRPFDTSLVEKYFGAGSLESRAFNFRIGNLLERCGESERRIAALVGQNDKNTEVSQLIGVEVYSGCNFVILCTARTKVFLLCVFPEYFLDNS